MDLKNVFTISVFYACLIYLSFATENATFPPDYDLSLPIVPTVQLPKNVTLKKCWCQESEEWNGLRCVQKETFLEVVDLEFGIGDTFSTSNFSHVTIRSVECPPGLLEMTLFSPVDILFLLTNGDLLWHNGNKFFEDYCLEHVSGGWEAHVCVEPPIVPRCCPPGHVLGFDSVCIEDSSLDIFVPPVMHNGLFLKQIVTAQDYVVKDVSCIGVQSERHLILGSEGSLQYRPSPLPALLAYKSIYTSSEIPEENFCVGVHDSGDADTMYIAKFCYTDPKEEHHQLCQNSSCVRKCCPARQFMLNGFCAELNELEEDWNPIFHEKGSLRPGADAPEDLFAVYGVPICENFFEVERNEIDTDKTYLLSDGILHWPGHGNITSDRYCLDNEMNDNGNMVEIVLVCESENLVCEWKGVLNTVLLSISCIFLVATLGVYLGVADLRERTNGRCLISLVVSMLAAFISLIVNGADRSPTDLQCVLRGFFGHVFTLAMFFWLNVMCYDMWSTLRSSQQQHQSKKTFIKYSIYAWGVPLVIAITSRILDAVQPENWILPNFLRHKTCWFRGVEYWLYLFGFVLLLTLVNLFFFIHVAVTLARKLRQRQTVFDNSNSRSSNSNKAKQQAWLYVRLFIVMGVAWIADICSSFNSRNVCSLWIIADVINGLQGVFIFLVAVCNRDNIKKFRSAWNPRVESMRTKLSTIRGMSPVSASRRKTDVSLGTSEASRKTSTTSIPRKISSTSVPLTHLQSKNLRHSNSPPPRKFSAASNQETTPMNPIEE